MSTGRREAWWALRLGVLAVSRPLAFVEEDAVEIDGPLKVPSSAVGR